MVSDPNRGERQGPYIYNPFSGRMRFGHRHGFGGLDRRTIVLWIINTVALCTCFAAAVYLGSPLATFAIFLGAFLCEALVLHLLFRRRLRRAKTHDDPDAPPKDRA